MAVEEQSLCIFTCVLEQYDVIKVIRISDPEEADNRSGRMEELKSTL